MHAAPVEIADVLRLARNIEGLRRLGLHAERQFEGLEARIQPRIEPLPMMRFIQSAQQIELPPLRLLRGVRAADVSSAMTRRSGASGSSRRNSSA